jgi:hypothetical protein
MVSPLPVPVGPLPGPVAPPQTLAQQMASLQAVVTALQTSMSNATSTISGQNDQISSLLKAIAALQNRQNVVVRQMIYTLPALQIGPSTRPVLWADSAGNPAPLPSASYTVLAALQSGTSIGKITAEPVAMTAAGCTINVNNGGVVALSAGVVTLSVTALYIGS